MKIIKHLFLLLITLNVWSAVNGQQTNKVEPGKVDQKHFESLRAAGFEALYNHDYDTARAKFKELMQAYPDHPAGPQFLAASLWLQTLNESRRLQTTLYNSDSFYAKTEDTVDPKIVEQFREWTKQAKLLAEARLKRDPRDTEALYFLGAVEGLKAAFVGAVERRFIAALRDSSRAVDKHRELIKLDPTFHDAELIIGLYDYVVGSLPLPVKMLASVTGVRGSKRRGIETLQRVASQGKWARDDAKVVLIGILKREGRFREALELARELAAKYERNYLFKLEVADALVSGVAAERKARKGTSNSPLSSTVTNEEREAFGIFEALLQQERGTKNNINRALDLIHFRYAEALLAAGQAERAAKEFLAAATVPSAEPGIATMARLSAAQALDLANRRNEALTQYQAVLARPNVYDAHDKARRGLREPYRKATLTVTQEASSN